VAAGEGGRIDVRVGERGCPVDSADRQLGMKPAGVETLEDRGCGRGELRRAVTTADVGGRVEDRDHELPGGRAVPRIGPVSIDQRKHRRPDPTRTGRRGKPKHQLSGFGRPPRTGRGGTGRGGASRGRTGRGVARPGVSGQDPGEGCGGGGGEEGSSSHGNHRRSDWRLTSGVRPDLHPKIQPMVDGWAGPGGTAVR
jgi:hypothetical protein